MFAIPTPHAPWDLQFDSSLILPFVIAGIAASIKAIGVISTNQKIDDADWATPDMTSIRGGVLASGLSVISSSLLGGMASSPSASNVGLAMATGVASRRIGIAAGIIFIVFAFSPFVAAAFVILPVPVKGAILIYVACFMIVSDLQLVMSRPMDTRTIFVVGTSIVAGLAVDFLPDLFTQLPPSFHAVTGSPLSFATVVAIGLNMIFRFGITRSSTLTYDVRQSSLDDLEAFLRDNSRQWGIREDVVHRVAATLVELADIVIPQQNASEMQVSLYFDKVNVVVHVLYDGDEIVFPNSPPDPDQILAGGEHVHHLSAHLVHATADKIKSTRFNNRNLLHMHFRH